MNESTGKGASQLTDAGHSAVYLSNICPASPVKLRLCRPGEEGSVVSNYTSFRETGSYEWNIVPLSVFLYGVEDSSDAPLYGNEAALKLLREQYRKKYLDSICPAEVAATRRRGGGGIWWARLLYAGFTCFFRMKTTEEQDRRLVEEFNLLPNENHYNGFTRNCADFARGVVNRYFPNAAKPDHLNDGMTTPKAISKSFTHYGEARPELQFVAERFDQLPGQMPRSSPCRKGTEVAFRMKKWFIPLMLVRSHELPVFVAAYTLTGRFNPDREVTRHPAEEAGSTQFWMTYRNAYEEVLDKALRDGVFVNSREVKSYFKKLDRAGRVKLDGDGLPVLEVKGRLVALSRGNLLAAGSDPLMSYQIMLARVRESLWTPVTQRQSRVNFKKDWDLLIRARERFSEIGN